MARPPAGRVIRQRCRCGSTVLTARDVLDDRVTIGADERFIGAETEAELLLAGRPSWRYEADHAGHSWLAPRFKPQLIRELLGQERRRGLIVPDHVCQETSS